MVKVKDLPLEVLHCIFARLESGDLNQCQRTCRPWRDSAQQLCYEHVRLTTYDQASLFHRTLETQHFFVKSLDVSDLFSKTFVTFDPSQQTLFDVICLCLPSLKSLDADTPARFFWECLNRELDKLSKRLLQHIPQSYNTFDMKQYASTATSLTSRLEQLTLIQEEPARSLPNFHDLALNLHEFSHLKSLKIEIATNQCLYSFDYFINQCPFLESCSIAAVPLTHAAAVENNLQDDSLHQYFHINLDLIQPRPGVKKLEGCFIMYTDESIKYMMHKFPNLDSLTINTGKLRMNFCHKVVETSKTSISTNMMTRYLHYIFNIPSFFVDRISLIDPSQFLAEFFDNAKFSGLLDIIYEDLFDFNWAWQVNESGDYDGMPRIQVDNHHFDENIPSKYQGLTKTTEPAIRAYFLTELKKNISQDVGMPHLPFLDSLGQFIKHLRISDFDKKVITSFEGRKHKQAMETFQDILDGAYLDSILCYCRNLTSLTLRNSSSLVLNRSYPIMLGRQLQRLVLSKCQIDPKILTQLSCGLHSLNHLTLSQVTVVYPHNLLYKSSFEINMPYTSFDTLFYSGDERLATLYSKEYWSYFFCAKIIQSDKGITYLKADGSHEFTLASQIEYDTSVPSHDPTFALVIICKSIKQLCIKLNSTQYLNYSFIQ